MQAICTSQLHKCGQWTGSKISLLFKENKGDLT